MRTPILLKEHPLAGVILLNPTAVIADVILVFLL
jgi:hypothetical protein